MGGGEKGTHGKGGCMCVCVCVCACVRACVHACIHACVCVHVCIHVRLEKSIGHSHYLWSLPFLACTLQIDTLEHKLKELHQSTAMSLEEANIAASEQISNLKLAPVCPTTYSHKWEQPDDTHAAC